MSFLQVAAADFPRRDMRRGRRHWYARTMTVEQAVDQMRITRPATTGAHSERTRQVCFGTRGKCNDLFMPHMNPLDRAVTTDRLGQAVEAIADDAVHALDARSYQYFNKLLATFIDITILQ